MTTHHQYFVLIFIILLSLKSTLQNAISIEGDRIRRQIVPVSFKHCPRGQRLDAFSRCVKDRSWKPYGGKVLRIPTSSTEITTSATDSTTTTDRTIEFQFTDSKVEKISNTDNSGDLTQLLQTTTVTDPIPTAETPVDLTQLPQTSTVTDPILAAQTPVDLTQLPQTSTVTAPIPSAETPVDLTQLPQTSTVTEPIPSAETPVDLTQLPQTTTLMDSILTAETPGDLITLPTATGNTVTEEMAWTTRIPVDENDKTTIPIPEDTSFDQNYKPTTSKPTSIISELKNENINPEVITGVANVQNEIQQLGGPGPHPHDPTDDTHPNCFKKEEELLRKSAYEDYEY